MNPLLSIIIGFFIAVVSSWVTVNLSLRRYHSERWWDTKKETYSAIIAALHYYKSFLDENILVEMHGRKLSEETEKELQARAQKAKAEIAKTADVGAFLLSDEALLCIRQYQQEEVKLYVKGSWVDYLCEVQIATKACLDDIIRIAKRDLIPESALLRWFL
jgi:hypothetical protein